MAVALKRRDYWIAVALAGATLVLYGWHLAASPMHLHYDEIFFGLQAHSIQATGRDMNGLFLPVYFQLESTMNWYQPMGVYWTALVLWLLPLSDSAIRWPSVLVAAANVVLIFCLARRIFKNTGWAVVTALLLMLTPAHYIHSRLAMDYIYPLPFLLGWANSVVGYLERPSARLIALAGACLGVGFFSYIAGTALTPMFLGATVALLWWRGEWSRIPFAVAGFAAPLLAAAIFIAFYPDVVPHLMGKYGLIGHGSDGLDPLQKLRASFTNNAVSDWLNHYWLFYSPGYLFVTGGSNLTNSTRMAGVFLPPLAVFMVAGIIQAVLRWRAIGAIVLFGFFIAALPATLMEDEFAVDRELAVVPFAVLLSVMGAEWMWRAAASRPVAGIARAAGVGLAVISVGYAAMTLVSRGALSASTPVLLLAGIISYAMGFAIDRRRDWSPVVAALLLLVPLLFMPFLRDYFVGYPLRSAGWFGGNIRGAIEETIRRGDASNATQIHISTDIPYVRSYWRFYLLVLGRPELAERTKAFDHISFDASSFRPGEVVLAAATDEMIASLVAAGQLRREAIVTDSPDLPLTEQFLVLSVPR